MIKKHVGLIRVLTTTDTTLLNFHGERVMKYFPELNVVSACIPDQPEGIHDDATERIAVPKVLALAQDMEKNGARAVIVSCAGDPAVPEAVASLGIPVIGAGRAAASLARSLELPVGVLGITEKVPAGILSILGTYFCAELVPQGVVSTLDLMKPDGLEATITAGKILKGRGAKAILLACTGMSTIGVAEKLREALDIPVIDPVRAEAAAAWVALG